MTVSADRVIPLDLGELYAAHRLSLVRLAVLLVDDRASAEDVVQDAFAGLATHGSRPAATPTKALAYLRQAVVNRSRSALRRRRTAPRLLPSAQPRGRPARRARRPRRGAPRDPGRPRPARAAPARGPGPALLVRACRRPRSPQALGISRGAVKSTASRALDRLETIMEGAGMTTALEDRLAAALHARADLVQPEETCGTCARSRRTPTPLWRRPAGRRRWSLRRRRCRRGARVAAGGTRRPPPGQRRTHPAAPRRAAPTGSRCHPADVAPPTA